MNSRGHGLKFQKGPGNSKALHSSMQKVMKGLEEEGQQPILGTGGTVPEHKKKTKHKQIALKTKLFKETEGHGE